MPIDTAYFGVGDNRAHVCLCRFESNGRRLVFVGEGILNLISGGYNTHLDYDNISYVD